eukprot:Sdes_comp20660_c0_seq1m15970
MMRWCTPRFPAPLWGARCYHSRFGCYGYRIRKEIGKMKETKAVVKNRIENSNLLRMVMAYRRYGHRNADIDPLGLLPRITSNELELGTYGFAVEDGTQHAITGIMYEDARKKYATIGEIHQHLNAVYCGKIGYEFQHIPVAEEREWFSAKLEKWSVNAKERLSAAEKLNMHRLLAESEIFDKFMQKKFGKVKRYSGEGAESMLVGFEQLCARSAQYGVEELVLCMPHRGRLNLLTGFLQFPKDKFFYKLAGNPEIPAGFEGVNDVISHLFCSTDLTFAQDRPFHISMIPNPSHLEACNPVAVGKARAKQMHLADGDYKNDMSCTIGDKVMCVQFHGDAAFSAQGIVAETFQLSNLPHYTIGGSIHIVVNNQLGFTTPADRGRSSMYSSDIGKIIDCPVIHVNGDYPEEVAKACRIAADYRNVFRKDVIVDMLCYRKWGHNELDDPSFTQPLMYSRIQGRDSVPEKYEQHLVSEGVITAQEAQEVKNNYWAQLDAYLEKSRSYQPLPDCFQGNWAPMSQAKRTKIPVQTGVPLEKLLVIGEKSVSVPPNSVIHPRLVKGHIDSRLEKLKANTIDWATAEALAVGSLLVEKKPVRISGQDVGRGTFSHRHFMLVDQIDDSCYVPLNLLSSSQSFLEVANSELSELAVLGFEYGLSTENPNGLYIWEAQFGDFFNGAQIIIDTYISCGEAKWLRQSGLVMLLPHGFDGAGPEHSSCRIERFLQLTDSSVRGVDGDNVNMSVVIRQPRLSTFIYYDDKCVDLFANPWWWLLPKPSSASHPQSRKSNPWVLALISNRFWWTSALPGSR